MMTMAGTPGPAAPPTEQQRRMRPEDAMAAHITVSDPVQHADGLNKYTSYRVDVRPPAMQPPADNVPQDVILAGNNLPANQQTGYSAVLRRYSDFLWLYERLHVERAGAIVPPIPEKQPVGRFSPTFVEERRVQLERFLRRVAVHPELADAAAFGLFLRADDVTFQAAKHAKSSGAATGTPIMSASQMQSSMMQFPNSANTTMTAAHSPPKKEGLKRWFAETKTSMTGDLVRSPDDAIFEEIQRYVHGLDTQMKNVSQQASGLVRKGKEIANGLFEFGLAFNLLGQSEGDALGDALTRMGETADRLSVLSAEHAEQEMAQFEEPLQDYIKLIHAVKLALQRRHEKRLTYSTCLSEVDSKQQQLGKLRAQIGSESKAYQVEMALRQAHESSEMAAQDFATVSQRVLREVDRFKREKAEEMRWTVLNYIQLQVEYNKRMEQVWATLIPQLEGVQQQQQQQPQPGNVADPNAATNNNNSAMGGGAAAPGAIQQQQQQPGGVMPAVSPDNSQHHHQPGMLPQQQQPAMQQQPMVQQSHEIPQYDMSASMMSGSMAASATNNAPGTAAGPMVPPPAAGPPPPGGGDSMINVQYR